MKQVKANIYLDFSQLKFLGARLLLLFFAFHLTLNSGLIVFEDKDAFIKICKKRYVLVMDLPQLNPVHENSEVPAEEQTAPECSPSVSAFIITSSEMKMPGISFPPAYYAQYNSKNPDSPQYLVEVPPPRS